MIVRELLTRLGFQVDEAGADKYEQRLGHVRSQAQSLSRLLFKGLALFGAGSLFGQFTQIADQMTDYESRVRLAIGATGDLEKTMTDLKNLALNTYSSFDQTTESFLRNNEVLRELGHTYDESLAYTASLNDALVISGTKGDDAAAVMNNLNRAMQMGYLKGDQFNAVMSRGGRIAELLRRRYGKTTDQLREMAADGLIPMPEFFEMMTEAGEENRKMAADMPQTYADARQNMRTELGEMVRLINNVAGTTAFLAEMVDQARFAMVEWTPRIIEAIKYIDEIGQSLGGWAEVFKVIGYGIAAFASSQVIANLGSLAVAFYRLAWPLLFIVSLGFLIEDFIGWLQGKDSAFGDLFGPVEEHAEAVEKLKKAWQFIKPLLKNVKVLYGILALVAGIKLGAWTLALGKGLFNILKLLGPLASGIRIVSLALWALAANPAFWTIMAIVAAIAALVAIGYDFYQWVTGGESYLKDWFGPWEDVVEKVKEKWAGLVAWLVETFMSYVGIWTSLLNGDFKGAWDNLLTLLGNLWDLWWDLSIFGALERWSPGLFDPIRKAFDTAIETLKAAWESFLKWIGDQIPVLRWTQAIDDATGGEEGTFWRNTEEGIDQMRQSQPAHPYGNMGGGGTTTGDPPAATEPATRSIGRQSSLLPDDRKLAHIPTSIPGVGALNDAGQPVLAGYRPPAEVAGRGGPRAGNNINVDLTGMAFNVTVPEGTTEDQARGIYENLDSNIHAALDRAIRSAMSDFPDAEEA